jgi:glycosyltransferase involved in cell wall biosynthesis
VTEELHETGAVDVSVIVPTLDSAAHLGRCLRSVNEQNGVRVETIVVDQESTDETAAIARASGATLIQAPRPQFYSPPTKARNLGARRAAGEYLLHLDSDMAVAPGLLAAAVRRCREERFDALVLHEVDVAEGFWARCKALERMCYRGVEQVEGARFVRADLFRAVGGYDEGLGSGEDWDIHTRYQNEGQIGDVAEPLVHHLGRIRFTRQIRKKYSYGRTARDFLRKSAGVPIATAMLRSYWHARRMLVRRPHLAAGALILRSAEAAAVAAGMLTASRSRAQAQ